MKLYNKVYILYSKVFRNRAALVGLQIDPSQLSLQYIFVYKHCIQFVTSRLCFLTLNWSFNDNMEKVYSVEKIEALDSYIQCLKKSLNFHFIWCCSLLLRYPFSDSFVLVWKICT